MKKHQRLSKSSSLTPGLEVLALIVTPLVPILIENTPIRVDWFSALSVVQNVSLRVLRQDKNKDIITILLVDMPGWDVETSNRLVNRILSQL